MKALSDIEYALHVTDKAEETFESIGCTTK